MTYFGALQIGFEKSEIILEVSYWVQISRKKIIGKSSQNNPILVLIFWDSIPCVSCLYTLLKFVSHFDFECSVYVSDEFLKNSGASG